MKVDYRPNIKEKYLRRKKSVHINISETRHRVLKAHLSLYNTSIQSFFEEICARVCEEDEYVMSIIKDIQDRKRNEQFKNLVAEEKDELYRFIEEESWWKT